MVSNWLSSLILKIGFVKTRNSHVDAVGFILLSDIHRRNRNTSSSWFYQTWRKIIKELFHQSVK